MLGNNKYRIDSITTKRGISPHQADFTSVHHLTTPKPPKDSRGSDSARIFLGPHYYCRRLRRCYRIRAGSLASRKEPLIFPLPILLRSFSTSTRQSFSYLDPCISLNVSIIPFSLHVKDRSKSLPHPSFTTSQNLFRFIWLFMPRMPVDMPVVIRHAAILFRFEQIPVRELDGSSIELECLSSLLSMYYRAKLLLLSMRESFVIIRREVNNHLSLNLPTYA